MLLIPPQLWECIPAPQHTEVNSGLRGQFPGTVLSTGENLARLWGESVLTLHKGKVLLELASRLD